MNDTLQQNQTYRFLHCPAKADSARSAGKKMIALVALAAIIFGAIFFVNGRGMYLEIRDQKTGQLFARARVSDGDALCLSLTHSFEHIPWNEYYIVQHDGTFLLQRIEVGGFGAGVPAEMDVPTYVGEDGLVHMDEINSVFPEFRWITSQKNMKTLTLNGTVILDFSAIAHHSFLICQIK